jgi:hypothetical protein
MVIRAELAAHAEMPLPADRGVVARALEMRGDSGGALGQPSVIPILERPANSETGRRTAGPKRGPRWRAGGVAVLVADVTPAKIVRHHHNDIWMRGTVRPKGSCNGKPAGHRAQRRAVFRWRGPHWRW